MNTGEYALQMCRPVTLQVNTLTDGQLRTGWPHRLPPRESAEEVRGEGGGVQEEKKKKRRRRSWEEGMGEGGEERSLC